MKILKNQLATESTVQNDYGADVRETLPLVYRDTQQWCVVEILKNQLATESTVQND